MDVLNTNVLVLNKSYVPVWIATAKRAFIMLCSKAAEVVSVEDGSYITYDIDSWAEVSELKRELEETNGLEDWVFTSRKVFEVPRVVRLLEYNKVPNKKVRLSRRNIYYRDGNICQYCGKKFNTQDLNLDHIIPSSRGGKSTWKNLVCSCYKCNTKKRDRTPREAGVKLIREPFEPRFIPHMLIDPNNRKYNSWKSFLSEVYWNVELGE